MAAVLREVGGFEQALDQHLMIERARPPAANGKGYGSRSAKSRLVGWGTLIGWQAIADYFGISIMTAMRWRKRERLPVGNLPDGRVAITLSLVDQWLMARHEAQSQSAQPRAAEQHGQEQARGACEALYVDAYIAWLMADRSRVAYVFPWSKSQMRESDKIRRQLEHRGIRIVVVDTTDYDSKSIAAEIEAALSQESIAA